MAWYATDAEEEKSIITGTILTNELNSATLTDVMSIQNVEPGIYIASAFGSFVANSTGVRQITISTTSQSGANSISVSAASVGATGLTLTRLIKINQTSTLYFVAYQTSGSKLNINSTYLYLYKLD